MMALKGGRAQDWNPLERLASTGRTPTLRQEGRRDVGILENWVGLLIWSRKDYEPLLSRGCLEASNS